MKTQAEGLAWIGGGWKSSPFARTIQGVGQGIDVDGLYGFQCKDFSNGYAAFMGAPFTAGNAIALWDWVQVGWEKVGDPQPGYVFVKDYYSGGINYGHTGIVERLVAGGFYSVDQNWFNSSLTVGSPPAEVFHPLSSIKGYLRPQGGFMQATITLENQVAMCLAVMGRQPSNDEEKQFIGKPATQANLDNMVTFWAGKSRIAELEKALGDAHSGSAPLNKAAVLDYLNKNLN